MGLGRSERRLLSQIERALRGSDPKLARALTTFSRRMSHLQMPHWERLRPSRVVQYAPVAMCVFVLSMILISATVLSRLSPAPSQADRCLRYRLGPGLLESTASAASTHTAHSTTNH